MLTLTARYTWRHSLSFQFEVSLLYFKSFVNEGSCLFELPEIYRANKNNISIVLQTMALRAFLGSCATLTSTVVNLTVLMALDGEKGWICLTCCLADSKKACSPFIRHLCIKQTDHPSSHLYCLCPSLGDVGRSRQQLYTSWQQFKRQQTTLFSRSSLGRWSSLWKWFNLGRRSSLGRWSDRHQSPLWLVECRAICQPEPEGSSNGEYRNRHRQRVSGW